MGKKKSNKRTPSSVTPAPVDVPPTAPPSTKITATATAQMSTNTVEPRPASAPVNNDTSEEALDAYEAEKLLVTRKFLMDLYQKAYMEGQSEAYPRGWKEGMDEGYSSGHAGGFLEGRKAGIVEAAIKMVKNQPEPVPTVEVAIQTESSPLPSSASACIQTATILPAPSPAAPLIPPPRTSTPHCHDPDPDISWSDVIPEPTTFIVPHFIWSDEADNPSPPPMFTTRDFSDLRSSDIKNPFSSLARRRHHRHKHSRSRSHSASKFFSSSLLHHNPQFTPFLRNDTAHIPHWRSLKSFIRSIVLETTRTSSHLKGGTWSSG
jgi:hypothetical protein